MCKPQPFPRNWPSPDELAAVEHGIRQLVVTLEPVQAEPNGRTGSPRVQRIMTAIFRARFVAGDSSAPGSPTSDAGTRRISSARAAS
jgi:hypothetical protein